MSSANSCVANLVGFPRRSRLREAHSGRFESGCHSEITQQLFLCTPLTEKVTTTTLCHWATLASHSSSHRGCFPERLIQGRSAWCFGVSRPRSPRVNCCARLNDPPACPSIVGQGEAAQPRARASPDEQQFPLLLLPSVPKTPYTRNSLLIMSSVNLLGSKPRRRNAMRSSVASITLRLAEHSDSVTMAFSLTPSCFGKDPWHSRVAV